MTDYEYLFSTNLHAKLKERIQGGIFVKVNENDSLVIKITSVMKIISICLLQIFQIEC